MAFVGQKVPRIVGEGRQLEIRGKLLFCLAERAGKAALGKARRALHVILNHQMKWDSEPKDYESDLPKSSRWIKKIISMHLFYLICSLCVHNLKSI